MTNEIKDEPIGRLVTLRDAADLLGIPYFKVQRAARAGLVPTYALYNSRRLVIVEELLEVIRASRQGGVR